MAGFIKKQAGALCWWQKKIVLVSIDEGQHWSIPFDFIPDSEDSPQKIVEELAWQQAGVLGHAESKRAGEFLQSGGGKICKVEVFEIKASKFRDTWPRSGDISRALFTPEQAVEKVDEFGLRDIIERLQRQRERA